MIIDFHTHISENQEGLVGKFIEAMDANGVNTAVVLGIENRISNQMLANIVRKHNDRLIGFASVNPLREEATRDLERAVRELGLVGLKLHPSIQDFCPTDPRVVNVVRKAAELKIPIIFHTGFGLSGSNLRNNDPLYIDDLAFQVPEAVLIMGHGDIFYYGPFIAKRHANVYLETSHSWIWFSKMIKGIGERTVREFPHLGAGKILFGTDAGPHIADERFKENLGLINGLEISQEEKSMILGGNAKRILGL